jgi:hypothetical protein
MLAVALCAVEPALAQNSPAPQTGKPSPTAEAQNPSPAQTRVAASDQLSAMQIEVLVAPFAGASPDALGIVFDAARYPAELLEAAEWLRRPEAERGAADATWPPSVRRLAERAPQAIVYLTSDMRSTAALGAAYQNQPNDVWLAYGKITQQLQAQQDLAGAPPPQSEAVQGGSSALPPATLEKTAQSEVAAAPAPSATPAAPATPPAQITVVNPAPVTVTPAPIVTTPAPVVVTQAPAATTSGDTTGAALMGGAVGMVGGLALASLLDDDDDWGHSYPAAGAYPYPRPYPYAGGGGYARPYPASTGAYAGNASALQQNRQAAGSQMQQNSQAATSQRQQQRQAVSGQQQQSRQQAASQRQQSSQAATSQRQQQRQASAGQTAGSTQAAARTQSADGTTRRAAATGQQRPQQVAQRQPAQAAAPARSAPARSAQAAPQRAAAKEWGPTAGMSGGGRAARSPGGGGGGGGGRGAGGRRG